MQAVRVTARNGVFLAAVPVHYGFHSMLVRVCCRQGAPQPSLFAVTVFFSLVQPGPIPEQTDLASGTGHAQEQGKLFISVVKS